MTEEFYCVWAYRYGNKEAYNFPVGLFLTEDKAIDAANTHRLYRGGKYGHLIYKIPIGQEFDAEECKPILEMMN